MRITFLLFLGLILSLGCARVRVEAPKEPIKVDISMRLDIYQHVEKDIDAIETIVSGGKEKAKPGDKQSLLDCFVSSVYAQEGLSPEVEQAALRRKDRLPELNSLLEKGVIGENKSGLVEARSAEKADAALEALIEAENSDRMVIYKSIADKNSTTVEEVRKLYAKRLQENAPSGTPVEVYSDASGAYEWKTK